MSIFFVGAGAGTPAAGLWGIAVVALGFMCLASLFSWRRHNNASVAIPSLFGMMVYHVGLVVLYAGKFKIMTLPAQQPEYIVHVSDHVLKLNASIFSNVAMGVHVALGALTLLALVVAMFCGKEKKVKLL
jgi:uncharacterized membrane protein HdeD (DUF308 family)